MVLIIFYTQEDEEFFYCLVQDLSFWQAFLLSLWTFFICCNKVCEIFQTLISEWLKESLKQCDFEPSRQETKDFVLPPKIKNLVLPSQTLEFVPCTPKHHHSHEKPFEYLWNLLLPLMNAFVIEHIFLKITYGPIDDVAPPLNKLRLTSSCGWIPFMACLELWNITTYFMVTQL